MPLLNFGPSPLSALLLLMQFFSGTTAVSAKPAPKPAPKTAAKPKAMPKTAPKPKQASAASAPAVGVDIHPHVDALPGAWSRERWCPTEGLGPVSHCSLSSRISCQIPGTPLEYPA
eukprot:301522-Chlamydomonas_euryale.AAC.8